eukprot:5977761-Karenia_brevis.AAC.1
MQAKNWRIGELGSTLFWVTDVLVALPPALGQTRARHWRDQCQQTKQLSTGSLQVWRGGRMQPCRARGS